MLTGVVATGVLAEEMGVLTTTVLFRGLTGTDGIELGAVPIGTDGVMIGYVCTGVLSGAVPVGMEGDGAVAGVVGTDWLLGMV